jgi:hypothetical protein
MVAHINAVRKGLKTQKLTVMSAPMKRTDRVMRVTSRETDTFLFVISFLFALSPHNNHTICKIPPNRWSPNLFAKSRKLSGLFAKEGLGRARNVITREYFI